jgi:hypothetical protein
MWKISCAVYFFPSISEINEERLTLFCKSKNIQCHQLPPTKTLCKNAYWDEISRQQFGNAPVSRYSVYHKQKKHGWVIEKRYVVRLLDGPAACTWGILMLLISCTCGCKTNCATKRCSCMSQGLLWTYGCKCSDLCQNTNRR